jgi:tetratricopeptide (TPR) repeat protein
VLHRESYACRGRGRQTGSLTTLVHLANTQLDIGDFSSALQSYQQCLRVGQELDAKAEIAKALTGIGIVHAAHTNYSIALEFYQRSVKIFEELEDPQGLSELMVEFHKRLNANAVQGRSRLSKAEALRAAALKLLKNKKYQHPFYWAAFVVVGDPS